MKKKMYFHICGILIPTVFLTVFLVSAMFYRMYTDQVQDEIEDETSYLATACNQIEDKIYYLQHLVLDGNTRVTLISSSGKVLYDSKIGKETLENHMERPEIREALSHGVGYSNRSSKTLKEMNFYYARLLEDGSILRLSGITNSIWGTFLRSIPGIILITIVVLVVALFLVNRSVDDILEPLTLLDPKEPMRTIPYPELQPLLEQLEGQNKNLKEKMTELARQKETHQAILEHMSEGLIIVDADSKIITANRACKELFHAPNMEYLGRHILFFNRSKEVERLLEKALQGESHSEVLEIEDRYLHLFASPVLDGDVLQGAVLFALDRTEKERAELIRREFSANVSHELKTPLTTISGYAELIKNGWIHTKDIEEVGGKIYRESSRLLSLINDIIKISHLDEGDGVSCDEEQELSAILKETIERLSEIAKAKDVTLELVESDPIIYKTMGRNMEELFYNLIENGIKYNKEGGKVFLSLKSKEKGFDFLVTDTGIGIPKEAQERIFERFYRVDKSHSKKTGGTGLGLAIVKHIVKYCHGTIVVESEILKGTKMKVSIPYENIKSNHLSR